MDQINNLAGRQWIANQEDFSISEGVIKICAIENGHCNRCGSVVERSLPNKKLYCHSCIGLGRIVQGDMLCRLKAVKNYPKQINCLNWQGELTKKQAKISQKLVDNFKNRHASLVHAVTGAGKTEMLFESIKTCLEMGKRVCIATPRIDVVNELFPRFQAAFERIKIGKYHGREFKEVEPEQFIICTTHQLLKYYQAFDLMIIDEVDSFPYINNPQLHFAAKNAVKEVGVSFYLTATPTEDLLAEVKTGHLEILKLKRRFHGGLLPVPKEQLFFKPFLKGNQLNQRLLKQIINAIKQKHPLLLFVPRIKEVDKYVEILKQQKLLAKIKIAGVHASDKKRLEKVEAFRKRKIDLLVTTTILERGVTFKHVWAIIVSADDEIYTASSLVQIAGRVGRAKDDQDGLVLFCYHKYTDQIKSAVMQIKEMNR